MNQLINVDQNYKEIFSSNDSFKKIEALYNLTFEEVDDELIKLITLLIEDADKAVKNAVSNFLIQNDNTTIPYLIAEYIKSPDITIRNLAGEILLKKNKASVEAISKKIPTLTNDDDIKFLIDILGLIGDKGAEDLLIQLLTTNQNENVIVACIEALGNISSEKSVKIIISFFNKTEVLNPVVIEALGKINTQDSLSFIKEKFECDDDFLKFTMIESMGEIGDEETFYFLLSQFDDLSAVLVWPLLESINKLRLKYNLEVPFDNKTKKCVLETILNSEPHYQKIAAHLVTVFDDAEILFACLGIYGLDAELDDVLFQKFMENRRTIFSKLHSVIDNSSKNLIMILELIHNMINVDSEILQSVTQLESRRITEALSKSLTNTDEVVRIAAAEILFKIDSSTALLFLDTMLSDENFWNRIKLIELLAEIDNPVAFEAIERLAKDPEEMVSEKAKEMALRKQYFTN